MKSPESIRWFQALAWAGIILLVVLIVAVRMLLNVLEVEREVPMGQRSGVAESQFVSPDEPLGELGSHCGGPLRLPCRPGLQCSVEGMNTQSLGLCERAPGASIIASQLQEKCELSMPCAPGLYCAVSNNTHTCKQSVGMVPKITSVSLEGMQFDEGTYMAAAGTQVTVKTQVVNAERVVLRHRPMEQEVRDLLPLVMGSDGLYTGTFTVQAGMTGTLDVLADAPATGFAVLPVAIEVMNE